MKTYLFSTLLLSLTTILLAQPAENIHDEFEFNVAVLNSLPLLIERGYLIDLNKAKLSSEYSQGYSLGIRYIKKYRKNVDWIFGIEVGNYSFNINLDIQENFRYLGWDGYFEKTTEYPIFYIAPEIGARYAILEPTKKSQLIISASVVAAYHIRSNGEFTQSAILDNGINKSLFYAELINNNENNVVIAPKLNLDYSYQFNDREKIFIGFTATFSNQTPFEGMYEIYGDNEVLKGVLRKKYSLMGLNIGYRQIITKKASH